LKNKIPIIIVSTLLLIAFTTCLIISASIRGTLRSQQAAVAWTGQSGERFSQLSVFIPDNVTLDFEARYNLRRAIDDALTAASFEADGERTLYADAWVAEGEVFVIGRRDPVNVKAIGVGGDFFLFNPLRLRDGSYITPHDIMHDRVVLDEELAWRLFGSARVAGLEVMIGNRTHVIAGVVARETDFASTRANTYNYMIFMSYESLNEQMNGEARATTYMLVMPNPITGFALQTLTEAFPSNDAIIVENTTRFSVMNIVENIRAFGERSMRIDGPKFPYWENAARFTEDWLSLLFVLTLLFGTCLFVLAIIYGTKTIRFAISRGKSRVKKIVKEREDRDAEKYMQESLEKEIQYSVNEIIREFSDKI